MYQNFLRALYNEANELIKEFDRAFPDINECKYEKDDNDDNKSYYHFISDRYENGKHVEHQEKEVKDGKVLKDVYNCAAIATKKEEEKKIEDGQKVKPEKTAAPKPEDKESEVVALKKRMEEKMEKLYEELKKVQSENEQLKTKLKKIEDLF